MFASLVAVVGGARIVEVRLGLVQRLHHIISVLVGSSRLPIGPTIAVRASIWIQIGIGVLSVPTSFIVAVSDSRAKSIVLDAV